MNKIRDAAYKEFVVKNHGAEVWLWRNEALPRNHAEIFNAGWSCNDATVKALEDKLQKGIDIAEKYATVYNEDKPDDWEDRADCMLWGIHRDLLDLKENK
jgi:hypothetical protein